MAIQFQVLGGPGKDNALFVKADSGHAVTRLLFDCGEGCALELPFAEVLAMDHLFFSHLHMDHIAGFDSFFRAVYDRAAKPNVLWGPPQSAAILQCRLRGFLWNLHAGREAAWRVQEIHSHCIRGARFELSEAFAVRHEERERPFARVALDAPDFMVEAFAMDHLTPSLAYVVREKPRWNVDPARLREMGLPPGSWLKALKEPVGEEVIEAGGKTYSREALREALLMQTPGDSIAYLTDFLLDEAARERLTVALKGCRAVVCESQYRQADAELARRNYHMTTVQAATLAREAAVAELILFHVSDRYTREDREIMLMEARAVFPNTHFPERWPQSGPPTPSLLTPDTGRGER